MNGNSESYFWPLFQRTAKIAASYATNWLVPILGGAAVLSGYWVILGWSSALGDLLVSVVVGIGGVILAALLFFVVRLPWTAKAIDKESQAKIAELESSLAEAEDDLRRQKEAIDEAAPRIVFSRPIRRPREEIIRHKMVASRPEHPTSSGPLEMIPAERHRVTLWRLRIDNVGAPAPEVRVKLVDVEPDADFKGLLPATLHQKDDNPEDRMSYEDSFPLATREPVMIDLMSSADEAPFQCFCTKPGLVTTLRKSDWM